MPIMLADLIARVPSEVEAKSVGYAIAFGLPFRRPLGPNAGLSFARQKMPRTIGLAHKSP